MLDKIAYNSLFDTCANCKLCDIAKDRTKLVFGDGNLEAKIMLIGEAPGQQEDFAGVPFVGRAGQLLSKIIEAVGLDRQNDFYITNTIKCRPPNNRKPLATEINNCNLYLKQQIKILEPKIIVLCGSVAMKMAFDDIKEGISKKRGKWLQWQGIDTIIVFHPSYLLRNASNKKGSPKWLTWQDFKEIKVARDYYQ